MARLRYNGLSTTLGAALTSTDATITFAGALTHAGGSSVPTIGGGDYIPLAILDASTGDLSEIVSLTAYTSGGTTGTITRAQESTTASAHSLGDNVVHAPTIADFATSGTGDASWTAPSLINSWINFGGAYANAGYRKDGQGIVHLRGMVKSGTTGSDIFVLPAGYRPSADLLMPVDAGTRPANVIVRSTGEVVNNLGGNTYFSLDGIHFFAA